MIPKMLMALGQGDG